jgi:septum formation protein
MHWRGLPPQLLLAADTTLELDGEIIGKPDNGEHAMEILRRLSGRTHQVLTAVVLTDGKRFAQRLSVSQVRFRRLDDDEIHHYVASGEAADKAGAYGIQGRAASSSRRSAAATAASWACPCSRLRPCCRNSAIL